MTASRVKTVASAYIFPGVSPMVKNMKAKCESLDAMREHYRSEEDR